MRCCPVSADSIPTVPIFHAYEEAYGSGGVDNSIPQTPRPTLMGILWDFMDGHPFVAAVFYSNQLSEEHWGKIVQPKAGGGRTTSVSIMTRDGVRTMCSGWVACCADSRYADFLNRHSGDALIPRRPVR